MSISSHFNPLEWLNSEDTRPSRHIHQLLVKRLAEHVDLSSDEINPAEPFVNLGVSSVEAVNMSVELEREFQSRLPDTLFWDCQNVEELAEYLTIVVRRQVARELLGRIDELSPEEVDAALEILDSESGGDSEVLADSKS